MFFSQYISIIVNSINMSIGRFLLISLQNNKDTESNEIFNTSLIIILFFILVQALSMGIILFDITYFFTIPHSLIEDALWLFGLTFIGFSISLFRSVFSTSLFSYNRLDILRSIDIFQNIVRVLTLVIFFSYDEPSLMYVGISNLVAALSAIILTLYYFKQYTPQLRINISYFKKKRVSELSSMSTWILINQVGVLLLGNIDLYLVNRLIGSQATSEYAIIIQTTSLFKTLITLVAGVLSPVILTYYANNEFEKLKNIIILASKGMVLFMIIPLGIVIALSENFLYLWIGNDYTYLYSIISFSLLFYIIIVPVIPLFNITMAYNKVKLPAIIAIGLGIINIISIYLFLRYSELELWGVVIIKLFSELIFSAFIIIYVSKILSIEIIKLLKAPILSIIIFFLIYSLAFYSKYLFNMDSLSNIMMISIMIAFIFLPLLYFSIFSKEERKFLTSKYKRKTSTRNLK